MTSEPTLTESQATRLVSASEIAEIAGVGPSAVSNWRSRHEDFPSPVVTGGRETFRLGDIVDWLIRNDRSFSLARRPDLRKTFWGFADLLRDVAPSDQLLDYFLALLALRSAADQDNSDRWYEIAESGDMEAVVALAMEASIELPELLSTRPGQTLSGLSKERARQLLQLVAVDNERGDELGEAVSMLIDDIGSRMRAGGEFYSPLSLAQLLVALAGPITGTVYDPTCGAGMLLAAAWRRRKDDTVRLLGQEINRSTLGLGKLHLYLHQARATLETGDTLLDDRYPDLSADHIVCDAPFGLKLRANLAGDTRLPFGLPNPQHSEFVWAQFIIHHLTPDGIGVMTCPPGVLSVQGSTAAVREAMTRAGVIEAVIQLAPGTLPTTSVPPALLMLRRGRILPSAEVLFVDATALGSPERGKTHELDRDDVERIREVVDHCRSGQFAPIPGFAAAATLADLEECGWDLTPRRHVPQELNLAELDGEPVASRVRRLRLAFEEEIADVALVAGGLPDPEPLHLMDQQYVTVPLGGVLQAKPDRGQRQKDSGREDSIPFIGLDALRNTQLTAAGPDQTWDFKRITTEPGDVLLGSMPPFRSTVVECDQAAAFADTIIRLRADRSTIDPSYLRMFLASRMGQAALERYAGGTTIRRLSPTSLQEVLIPLPPIEIQQAIAAAAQLFETAADRAATVASLGAALAEGVREWLMLPDDPIGEEAE